MGKEWTSTIGLGDDWSDLDALFSCPESITDPELRKLYEALYVRVTKELDNIEVSTGQIIQASLMTGWTVKHLQTSRQKYATEQGYSHPGQEKEAILALQNLLRDWNDIMLKARNQRDRGTHGVPVHVLQEVLATALGSLPQDTRVPIISKIATSLSEYTD
jgi:hypothetical protein